MAPSRVLVLYNEPVLLPDHPDFASENEIVETAATIGRILREAGFDVRRLGARQDPAVLLAGLRAECPDVVFNLFEGLATQAHTEATVVGLLEWLGIPVTGSPAPALSLALDKCRTKHLLRGAGLPTPAFFAVERLPCPVCPLPWPAIVKPARQDASVGIEQASVVTSQQQLETRVGHVLQRYGPPVLVEQFIRGREFHVHLIEEPETDSEERPLTLLPLAEIVFLEEDPSIWPIYSYDAKWRAESREYRATPLHSPILLEPERMATLGDLVRRAYQLMGCRDYARLDVRMTPAGEFYILEVNPNPFLNSRAVINGLAAQGRTHTQFIIDRVRRLLPASP